MCIELRNWADADEVDRLGLERVWEFLCEVRVPKYILPVSPGRNLSTLVETAVRAHLLKTTGHDAARDLIKKHTKAMKRGNRG